MKDYSNRQFTQKAIITARYEKGKYALALVRKRLSAVEVEIDPLTRRGAMTLRKARRLLIDYHPHEMLYQIEGYRGVLVTTKAGTSEAECAARLQAGHDREVTRLALRWATAGVPRRYTSGGDGAPGRRPAGLCGTAGAGSIALR